LHRIKHQPKSTIIEQHKKHQVGINHSSTVNQESHFEMFTAAPICAGRCCSAHSVTQPMATKASNSLN